MNGNKQNACNLVSIKYFCIKMSETRFKLSWKRRNAVENAKFTKSTGVRRWWNRNKKIEFLNYPTMFAYKCLYLEIRIQLVFTRRLLECLKFRKIKCNQAKRFFY